MPKRATVDLKANLFAVALTIFESAKLMTLKLKSSTSLRSGLKQFQFLNAACRQAL
jgi:hypothetical protein